VQYARSETIDRVLAIVGDKIITQYEVESFNPKKIKEIYAIPDEDKKTQSLKAYYQSVLEFLVNQYTLEEIGKKYNVVVTEQEAAEAIQDILARNKITEEELQEALEKEEITLAQYKWQIKMDILVTRLKSRVLNQLIVITDNDIRKYIDDNPKSVESYDQYELRYILLKDKNKLSDVKKAIKEKGFASAAIEFSDDTTGKAGGYLGFVTLEHLSEDIKNRLKTSKVKDIIEIENDKEVKLFFVESFKSKYDVSKEKREKIVADLMDARYKDVYKNWLEKNRSEIFIKYMVF
jgi:peptidyl-prolyl cis-trans isomerase SurA